MKKIIAICLSVVVLFSYACTAQAYYSGTECVSEDGNFLVNVYEDDVESYTDIIKYIGKDDFPEFYTIPEKINGNFVRIIHTGAFKNLKTLRNVAFSGRTFFDNNTSAIERRAFYNCDNMKSLTISTLVKVDDRGAGYSHGKPIEGFKYVCDENTFLTDKYDLNAVCRLANTNKFSAVYNIGTNPVIDYYYPNHYDDLVNTFNEYNTGLSFTAMVDGRTMTDWKSSDSKVLKVTSKGNATVLSKGKATLSVTCDGKTIKRNFLVKSNPFLCKKKVWKNENGYVSYATYKKLNSVSVKKGKTVKIEIIGKADSINNKYTNTKKAKIVSKQSAKTLKIKGLKHGTTTLKVKVNGVKTLKLKVKVK